MLGLSRRLLFVFELFLSSIIHLLFGFYIFSTAVAADLSHSLIGSIKPSYANEETRIRESIHELKKPKSENQSFSGANSVQSFSGANSVPPIVLVHGIFGFGKGRLGGLSYFAGAEKKDEFVLVPDLGSLTSIHDRARELFYYLKGGTVDYGEEHSKTFGHSRFGRVYEKGYYPEWDENHPVHFVGHSAGAQVVRVLQQMLHDKEFAGYDNTSEDWILSLTALSGALNGTTRTYFDGMRPEDGKSLKPICLLQLCRIGATIYEWLDIAWLKNYYHFGFDHFHMSWRYIGLSGLADLLLGNTGPFATADWILPDLTLQGSMKINAGLQTFKNTFYFSYATKMTRRIRGVTVPSSFVSTHPLLLIRVMQMCRWRYPADLPLPYKGYRDEDWEDNDGALNTISMTHPRIPVEHPSCLVENDSDCHPLQSGTWYYKIIEGDHIFFILNRERAGVQFDLIYDSIFRNCRKHVFRTSRQPTLPNLTSS